MVCIEIDDSTYEVQDGGNLLAACLTLGLDLPYFCWHPALGSAGACRQCAVIQYQDAGDTRGRLTMACMTPVTDGLRVSVSAEPARQFRRDNIELLMTNHPHDCPVCEEGGECHLQDMTLLTGHTQRRYRGKKRTHENQDLGPFINHEMNRCIACYRCIRYYQDYAGGRDLQVFGMHNNLYFGRFTEGALENPFSGNLVEVCPTGVFTDKTFSNHYARKWDLQTAPSICVHCSLGCNISPGERYGTLRRIVNRYNHAVNGYFLCDRGRFGYGFVNSDRRILAPRLQGRGPITVAAAVESFLDLARNAQGLIGIGSPRASLEANFALRTLVGADNFFLGLDETEHNLLNAIVEILLRGGIHSPALHEIELADAVLILGEDVTHSAPRMALALRQAVRNAALAQADNMHIPRWQDGAIQQLRAQLPSPLHIAAACATGLDDAAKTSYQGTPEAIARLGFLIAHCLDASAPVPNAISQTEQALAIAIAADLKSAKRPLVVSGGSCASLALIQAAYQAAKALPQAEKQLSFIVPECNSLGLALLGGRPLPQAFAMLSEGVADSVVILENDLYRRAAPQDLELLWDTAAHVALIDSLEHQTAEKAELILPAAVFAEAAGTLVNQEGRAQAYFPVYPAPTAVLPGWQWLTLAMEHAPWSHWVDLTKACAAANPALAGLLQLLNNPEFADISQKIPRQAQRYSGRTAMHAYQSAHETAPQQDRETPFAFSMEGSRLAVPAAWQPVIWAPGWNSTQAVNKFQTEIAGQLRGGELGARLLAAATGGLSWCTELPEASQTEPGIWRILHLPHIFGSDELSLHAAPIAARLPKRCALLNPQDAQALALSNGDPACISDLLALCNLNVPVHIESSLASGLLGLTAGHPEFQALKNGDKVTIKKIASAQQATEDYS
jgi:NADH-quinone oxidoreductase subunit G